MTGATHTRLACRFDGELDEIAPDAAAALARMIDALQQHGAGHDGRPATIRAARLGSLLNVWLTDPECSPACLCRSGDLPTGADHHNAPSGDVRLALDPGPDGGLRLHWALVLPEEAAAAPSVPPQRRER